MKKRFRYLFMFIFMFGLALCADFAFNKNVYVDVPQVVFAEEEEEPIVLPSSYCMRDEYFVLTTNQHGQGLCWNFASSSVFTTAVMKSTNQYIDYSEGWVSEAYSNQSQYYKPGDGGSFGGFESAIRNDGIVQEQDFNYEESYQVSRENVGDMHEYFSQFSDTGIVKNYRTKYYSISRNETEEVMEEQRNEIKRHLMTQSAFYVSFSWASGSAICNGKTVYFKHPNPTSTSGGHALCVIGWDDNLEVVFNNIKYKGAWIFLNSWGNSSGNEGIYYIFYDDVQVSSFSGYEYIEEYDDLYFFNKLVDSTAEFTSTKKGAYTGNFEATNADTKQKNIFTSPDNVSLTYSYKISENTSVTDISIFNFQKDVSDDFIIVNDKTNNLITITAKDRLDFSTYKVVFTYSNGEETESLCGAFSIINGTETEYISMSISPSLSTNTNTNFNLQGVRPLNNGPSTINYSVANEQGSMTINPRMSVYSSVNQLKIRNTATGNIIAESAYNSTPIKSTSVRFQYNLQSTNHYQLIIIHEEVEKVIDIYLLQVSTADGEVHARINYTLFGGENSENNLKSCSISQNKLVLLSAPTRLGYGFCGWYYSSDFNSKSILKNSGEDFYLEFDKIIHYPVYTVGYWLDYNASMAPYIFYSANIYAKWTKLEEGVEYHKIVSSIVGDGELGEVGIIYVPKGQDKKITINSIGFDVSEIYMDGYLLNSNYYPTFIQNGIDFLDISSNHSILVTFIPRNDTVYYVCHWLQSTEESNFEIDGKYYDVPIIELFRGTTLTLTDVQAKLFDHFIINDYEQAKISPYGDTIINIYYDREIFDITINFVGVKFGSTKYDVNEQVLYGQTKTYNLCPNGYKILSCTIDNRPSTLNSITFDNIDGSHTINVNLGTRLYNIEIDDIENGEIAYKGNLTNIDLGEIREFTVVADEGYVIKQVTVNGNVIETKEGMFRLLVSDDYIITVEIEEKPVVPDPIPDDPTPDDPTPDDPIPDDPTPDDPQEPEEPEDEIPELPPKDNSVPTSTIILVVGGISSPIVLFAIGFIIRKRRIGI